MKQPPSRFTCGRCKSHTNQPLTRWHELFVCPSCIDDLLDEEE